MDDRLNLAKALGLQLDDGLLGEGGQRYRIEDVHPYHRVVFIPSVSSLYSQR